MKRRVTITEGKPQTVCGVRLDVRRKKRHKRQFVVVIEIEQIAATAEKGKISDEGSI